MRLLLPLLTLSGCATVCPEPGAVKGRWQIMATVLSHEGGEAPGFPSYHTPANGPSVWDVVWGEADDGAVDLRIDDQGVDATGTWSDAECGRFELDVSGTYISQTQSKHVFEAAGEFVVWEDALEGAWRWTELWTHRDGETGHFEADGQVSGAREGSGG